MSRTIFIENSIPNNCTSPIRKQDSVNQPNDRNIAYLKGRKYYLLGRSEETFTFFQRVLVGVKVFLKTIFSLGLLLIFAKSVRDDWKAFWNGKHTVVVYSSCEMLAADQGHADAQLRLAEMYDAGRGVDQDDAKAAGYFQLAADQGHAGAQYALGERCRGRGIDRDDAKAAGYFQLAADQWHAGAQYALGRHYQFGLGVIQDDAKAARYYQLAADQGHVVAQMMIGHAYRTGIGVDQDVEKAVRYFQLAANWGYAEAQLQLAEMYRDGKGVARDMGKAERYYESYVKTMRRLCHNPLSVGRWLAKRSS